MEQNPESRLSIAAGPVLGVPAHLTAQIDELADGGAELECDHSAPTGNLLALHGESRPRNLGQGADGIQAVRQEADPESRDRDSLARTCRTTHAR